MGRLAVDLRGAPQFPDDLLDNDGICFAFDGPNQLATLICDGDADLTASHRDCG